MKDWLNWLAAAPYLIIGGVPTAFQVFVWLKSGHWVPLGFTDMLGEFHSEWSGIDKIVNFVGWLNPWVLIFLAGCQRTQGEL